MENIDLLLFNWINQWPDSLKYFLLPFSQGIKWTSIQIFFLLYTIALLSFKKSRPAILLALLCVPIANLICDHFKHNYAALRPCVELPYAIMRDYKLTSNGTISAHSANMATLAVIMTFFFRKWGAIWIPIAFLAGLSRVYFALHYPSQIVYGWITGGVVAGLALWIYSFLKNKNSSCKENDVRLQEPDLQEKLLHK